MKDFNNEYFFLLIPRDDRLPSLDPDKDSSYRDYRDNQIPEGSEPLFFHDGFLELKLHQNITPYDTPPDVLFDVWCPVVKSDIREALLNMDIANLIINQSVYIDYLDNWHENLWFLSLTKEFDCWDREKSEVDIDDDEDEDEYVGEPDVLRYYLNNALLAETPLRERLLFLMGGTGNAPKLVAHASVAKYFMGKSGVIVLPIRDYGVSDGNIKKYIM